MFIKLIWDSYKNGVGAPVLKGSVGAIVLGSKGSGGGILSFDKNEPSSLYNVNS
jgi:hypothetical protein